MSIKVRNLQEKKERVNKIVSDNAKLFGFSSEPAQTGNVADWAGVSEKQMWLTGSHANKAW